MSICSCLFLLSCSHKEKVELNRLSKASSPYLREHADNPVDWYEWGDEALERAAREGKPLIVSIGYASCHWCHVMEDETFMDTAVARVMNENFIAIKIDREERPDIDQIYLTAAQLISGNAGWPLNAFALPDGRPFYAATYFPKKQWLRLLEQVADTYANDQRTLRTQASELTKGVRIQDPFITEEEPAKKNFNELYANWQAQIDGDAGGLRGAPKFPLPSVWQSLLQHHYLTGDSAAIRAVTTTLDAMAGGGIYDHLAGGFARYSIDSLWRVPHFEKMLYDNAQLVSVYSNAFQVTANPRYKQVVQQTLDFIAEELTSEDGAFFSSLNADSEGEEGKFYVWTKAEIERELDRAQVDVVIQHFGITAEGNWERGKNVLYRNNNTSFDVPDEVRKWLRSARNRRVKPSIDTKVLTSWNALMIKGYIDAYFAFQDQSYLKTALHAADYLEKHHAEKSGHVWRIKTEDRSVEGFLDDYALLASAYTDLYQATFELTWLQRAKEITDYTLAHFRDNNSGLFYYTLDTMTNQIAPKIEVSDQVIPSSNSVIAEVLFQLGELYDASVYRDQFEAMIARISSEGLQTPYYANWMRVMELHASKPYQVAVVGTEAAERARSLFSNYLPNALPLGGTSENLPLLENKSVEGKTIIYVCRDRVCKQPVERIEDALKQMKPENR